MATTMSTELDKLFNNSNLFQKNGFQQLFTKFVSQEGQDSVEWDEIKKPPADSVGIILFCKVVDGMIFFWVNIDWKIVKFKMDTHDTIALN